MEKEKTESKKRQRREGMTGEMEGQGEGLEREPGEKKGQGEGLEREPGEKKGQESAEQEEQIWRGGQDAAQLDAWLASFMKECRLCPRNCGVNRLAGERGYCHTDARVTAARAALHMWEEPCISGTEGSGAVFFSGCSLGCRFCQNRDISGGKRGVAVTVEELAQTFLRLQEQGANNINLVTAGHYLPQAAAALRLSKKMGLHIPVVYNSSGYEKAETLRLLEGLVDIYLPDFKYMDSGLAKKYSNAADYPQTAKGALAEMVRQAGLPEFDSRGMMSRGVIVRQLLLPGHVSDSKKVTEYLYRTYGDRIYISLMNQYTPMPAMAGDPLLSRRVTEREYERLVDYAVSLGVENGFIQEGETAKESFIPAFDGEGLL